MSKLSDRIYSYDKTGLNQQQVPEAAHARTPSGSLKLAERISIAAAVHQHRLYESQLYAWRNKQQQLTLALAEREIGLAAAAKK